MSLGIRIARSSSNPGRLSVVIPDQRAFDCLVRIFPDMEGNEWLIGTTDSLGYSMHKEDDDRWVGGVWWEKSEQSGFDVHVRREYLGYNKGWHLKLELSPYRVRERFTSERGIATFKAGHKLNVKGEVIGALQRALNTCPSDSY